MTQPFSYTTTYKLDKSHFIETFEESMPAIPEAAEYRKALVFALIGAFLLFFTAISAYLAWFLVAIAVVEALSVRYRKSWWLGRQLISKAANSELTLTIDDEGVKTKSYYVDSSILWPDVSRLQATSRGWLIYHGAGKSYLSNRSLSTEAHQYLSTKATKLNT